MTTTPAAVAGAEPTPLRPLTESTIVLSIKIGALGTRQKVSADRVQLTKTNEPTVAADNQPDDDFLHVHKDILKCDELTNVRAQADEMRRFLRSRALPSRVIRGGMHLVPVAAVPEIEQRLEEMKATRRGLVTAFIAVYDAKVEEAREQLGDAFDARDYPSIDKVRRAFTIDVRYLSFSTPTSLRQISENLFQRESAKAQRAWESAQEEIVTMLRVQFKALVDHAAERLTPSTDGKGKVVRASVLSNINDFMEAFAPRNVCNDTQLAALIERMRTLTRGVDVATLKTNDSLRGQFSERFAEMARTLDGMVANRPGRRISFEDEVAAEPVAAAAVAE